MTDTETIQVDPLYDILIGGMIEKLGTAEEGCCLSMPLKSDHRPIEDVLHDIRNYLKARDVYGYAPLVGLGKEPGTIVIVLLEIPL